MDGTEQTLLADGYMPRPPLTIAEYEAAIGQSLAKSDWIRIDQAMIDAFSALTRDDQYIHTDPARAATTELGGTIAQGFLTLAFVGGLGPKTIHPIAGTRIGYNYGLDRVRFLAPVPAGARVRIVVSVLDVDRRDAAQVRLKFGVTVELEGSARPALVAEWLTLMVTH
jgi:acyl dehydratase